MIRMVRIWKLKLMNWG